jgi:hypothetical protein
MIERNYVKLPLTYGLSVFSREGTLSTSLDKVQSVNTCGGSTYNNVRERTLSKYFDKVLERENVWIHRSSLWGGFTSSQNIYENFDQNILQSSGPMCIKTDGSCIAISWRSS